MANDIQLSDRKRLYDGGLDVDETLTFLKFHGMFCKRDSTYLKIPYCYSFKDSLLRIYIAKDFTNISA